MSPTKPTGRKVPGVATMKRDRKVKKMSRPIRSSVIDLSANVASLSRCVQIE